MVLELQRFKQPTQNCLFKTTKKTQEKANHFFIIIHTIFFLITNYTP